MWIGSSMAVEIGKTDKNQAFLVRYPEGPQMKTR
jgi:hypothetical protein